MNPFQFNLIHASYIDLWKRTARLQCLHYKALLTEPSAVTSDDTHASFKPVPAMIEESAYYARALLPDSFFMVFLVQGVKEEIYTKLNKDFKALKWVKAIASESLSWHICFFDQLCTFQKPC